MMLHFLHLDVTNLTGRGFAKIPMPDCIVDQSPAVRKLRTTLHRMQRR